MPPSSDYRYFSRTNMMKMVKWQESKLDWWHKATINKKR